MQIKCPHSQERSWKEILLASGDIPGSLRSLLQKNQGKTLLRMILAGTHLVGASPVDECCQFGDKSQGIFLRCYTSAHP